MIGRDFSVGSGRAPMSGAKLYPALVAALLFAFCLSLLSGKYWLPPTDWFSGDTRAFIITELRLPRALLGAVIGAALGLSGAVLQGYVRNPLADPGVVGVSASAAFGAVLAIFFGFGSSFYWIAGSAMVGAIGSVILLTFLAGRSASAVSFVLAGTVLSTLAGALTTLVISLAPNPFAGSAILTWLLGALTDRGWNELFFAAPVMAVGCLLLFLSRRQLDALSLGEDVARTLGLDLAALQWIVAIGVGLAVGASVAVTGIVSFVGLIVPHLMRPLVGQKPSALLLPSALGGAILLLLADSLVRLVPGAGELKLGVAMALIGAPFFFWLLMQYRRRLA